ncbi:MAG: hypothetical protein KGL35_06450 [Bradyrhizobium sp.]|nr:hypothetical protein [Bradyrhizobium sp.]
MSLNCDNTGGYRAGVPDVCVFCEDAAWAKAEHEHEVESQRLYEEYFFPGGDR